MMVTVFGEVKQRIEKSFVLAFMTNVPIADTL